MRAFSILFLLLFLFSCKQNNNDDFSNLKYHRGKYKIYSTNEGKPANPGEYILYNILFKDNTGKVFQDSRDINNPLREHVIKDTSLLKDLTAVSEVLYKMSKGDSAFMFIPLMEEEKTADMKNSDTLLFYINVREVINEEKMRDIIEDDYLKQNAEETEARIKQIEVDQKIMKAWDMYKKGLLKDKLKRTKNGVECLILEEGKGPQLSKGSRVKLGYYGMTMKDATPFENSFRTGKDFEMVLGANQVIEGWDEAFMSMKEGTKTVIFVPSKLAFGHKGKPPIISPDADLVFYIELHKATK
ncbi:MAG TPA: hypothetical protein ENK91_00855 [Bacteroidetes bacterium]|nr:hypothetical protein [Bacteroidota bacterium]